MATDTEASQFGAHIGNTAPKRRLTRRADFVSRLLNRTRSVRFASLSSRDHSAYVAAETMLVSVIVIVACRVAMPSDPLLLAKDFPWLWLMPMFIALRYGTVAGIGCSITLLSAWALFYSVPPAPASFPHGFFVGGFVAVLLSGQFSDAWTTRLRRTRVSNDYLAERLSILTNTQFLLRLSHEQLEQDLLVKPATLRDALTRLRDVTLQEPALPASNASDASLIGAQCFLDVVAQACQIEAAQIYAFDDGTLSVQPVASVGLPFELKADDPLIVHALGTCALAHVQSPELRTDAHTRYIVCAPLISAGKEIMGILLISRIPFLALTAENLRSMFVLCGYYASGTRHAAITRDMLRVFPDCPYAFALEFARLVHLLRKTGIVSSIVVLVFNASRQAQELFDHVLQMDHGLHLRWTLRADGRRALILLMPLFGDVAVKRYLRQIEEDVRAQFGVELERAGVKVYWTQLSADAPSGALQRFLAGCNVAA